MDVNVIVRFRGFLEVQLHLAPIVKIKKEAHVAYEVGRTLELMGALGEADGTLMRRAQRGIDGLFCRYLMSTPSS